MNAAPDTRRSDLAKIHIAKKDLALDDETYRHIIREVGKVESGSSADLTPLGRTRVLQHFRSKGWKPRRSCAQHTQICAQPTQKRITPAGAILANPGQVGKIRSLWIQMADAGAIRDRTEQGLRRWVRSTTRRYHPQKAGYSAPEFLPARAAQLVIEQLKGWAKRCDIELHE